MDRIFSMLFDLSFSQFITIRIIKVLYLVAWVVAGVHVMIGVIAMFTMHWFAGLVALCLAPFVYVLLVMMARVWLECVAVVFTIAGHTAEIAKKG